MSIAQAVNASARRQRAGRRPQVSTSVVRQATADLPTRFGRFTAVGYRDRRTGADHVALVLGDVRDKQAVLVRVQSECLTGEVFASLRCDCGEQLTAAQERIGAAGLGVVVYLRGHEGRGIGLLNKLRAYALQDRGWDTVSANEHLGLPVDAREYAAVPEILADLGVKSASLMTNNPAKVESLQGSTVGLVRQLPMPAAVTPENASYLLAKRDQLGHQRLL